MGYLVSVWRLILFVLFVSLLSGCAGRLKQATGSYYAGNPQKALETLAKGDELGQRNRLLFLVEQGVIYHDIGNYQASIDVLLAAAELVAQYETISISEQTGSLVTSEWLTRYKGEASERLWVHTYLMMDFLQLGQFDSALVEAKRALKLLENHPESLKQAFFTRALIALCFANVGENNGAFLEYRKLADDLDDPSPVAIDLVRLARALAMPDEVERYKSFIAKDSGVEEAELVLFIANGRVPEKLPGNVFLPPSIRFSFPYYKDVQTPLYPVSLLPREIAEFPVISTDLGVVAKAALEERRGRIIVKETARVAAKEAISQSVGNNQGELAEVAVRLGLLLLEEPDVRCWQTLPGRLALLRIPLSAGHHELRVTFPAARPATVSGPISLPPFDVRSGQRIFMSLRF